jgi:enamine deaminase RidA (YjgF/YER057c/UK114 family)
MNISMTKTLAELVEAQGLVLPLVKVPAANYVSTQRVGNVLYVSGQISIDDAGAPDYFGRLGDRITVEEGYLAARSCALGVLAQLNAVVQGDVNRIKQLQRLGVFIAATPEFAAHSKVANGASDLIVNALGDRGRHARTAVGVASLPLGVAVEVDAIIELTQ